MDWGGRSAKFGVVVFKTSMLKWGAVGGRSAIRSAKFGVAVFKASMLNGLGGRSAKFAVVVFKTSMLKWGGQWVIDLPLDLPSLV